MADSERGTGTNNTLGGEYEVFLSFRGSDTREGFTSVLYRALVDIGIRVFIDDRDLRLGERISDDLPRAIDNSQVYIPIFSKNYASSHWCLDELVKMVENNSKSKEDGKEKVILPIFYKVKPDDVKLKTELYTKAISNLAQNKEGREKKFKSNIIMAWQQALKEVGGIAGLELEKYGSDGNLLETVVEAVMSRLETRQIRVTEDLVGLDYQIAAIKKLLDIASNDVRLIGICGMGGIGKTTLAMVISNQLRPHFGKYVSFLEDVREKAKTKKGMVELQEQLLTDISYSRVADEIFNIDHGIKRIEETICSKKALIVLDDVDEAKQIQQLIGDKSLFPGTRILVTTRDKSVFIKSRKYTFEKYEMERLSNKDSLTLFSRHAFNKDSPPPGYYALSKSIVSTASGLPLALEAIGSSLLHENRGIWEEYLEKLKKTPHDEVFEKLKITYDTLKPSQQQIFLDIACFFIGWNKTNPMHLWKGCGFFPKMDIEVLIRRCMIKVSGYDKFHMHDQFKDLGRAIAKKERTRLWDKDDIMCELRSIETKGSIQALRWQSRDRTIVTSEQIKRFPHLQFLWLHEVICQGDFTGCLSELKWINMSYLPTAINREVRNQRLEATNLLHLERVVVVSLSALDIPEDVFEGLIKGAGRLKVLSIKFNSSVRRIPAFPKDSTLEKLTISDFNSLTKIDRAIGKLRCLTDLTFDYCFQLEELPEEIGELRNLRHLSFSSCGLIKLPDSVSQLTSLETLDVSFTKITRLPDSIGRLLNLSSIDLTFTPIEQLPSTMSELLDLRTLHLGNCHRMQELPKLLPRSLTNLRLSSTSLVAVPNLSDLTNLVELDLSDASQSCSRSDTVQSGDLRWIESLSKLRKLHLCFSNVCAPTTELGSLSQLEELALYGLGVPTFEQLPSKLIVLELHNTQWTQVRLPPQEIVSSSSKELLEDEAFRKIQFLESHGTSKMSARLREELGGSELQAPQLIDHWRGAFFFPSSLKLLQQFSLCWCPKVQDIEFVSTWESLLELYVQGCTSLKSLVGLSNSKNLRRLTLDRCPSLQVVEGIDELEFLCELYIEECRSMGRIFDASSSKIPNKCHTLITRSGELLDCGNTFFNWESYKEAILNGTNLAPPFKIGTKDAETEIGEQVPDSEIETKDAETETGDPLQKTNQENKEKKRKRKTQSAKQGGGRKRRKLLQKPLQRLSHLIISSCRTRNMKRRKERASRSAKEQGKRRGK